MNKKGFTLIELLAVIVILAIIALITVPVVTQIISSSQTKTIETSVKNYIRAVENDLLVKEMEGSLVANGTYQIMSNGNICLSGTVSNCTNIFSINIDGTKPSEGSITITDNKVTSLVDVLFNEWLVSMGSNGVITIGEYNPNAICKAVDGIKSTALGTKYTCKVNSSQSYDFYVLSTSGNYVNLLMSENLVDNYTYVDEESIQQVETEAEVNFYDSNNWSKLSTEVVNLTSTWTNLSQSARLPEFEELANEYVCSSEVLKDYGEIYMYNSDDYYYEECPEWSKGDYWTSTRHYYYGVWAMNTQYNTLDSFEIFAWETGELTSRTFGIRPVITVSASNLN